MTNFIYLADVLAWLIFLLIYAAKPGHSTLSQYELNRLAKSGDKHAQSLINRNRLLPGAILIKKWVLIILVSLIIWITVTINGWFLGIIVSVILIALAEVLSRWQVVSGLSRKYWTKLEPQLLLLIHKYANWLVGLGPKEHGSNMTIHSQQELAHIIDSNHVLSDEQKARLQASLVFGDTVVSDIMLSRNEIEFVDQNDTLGPIILDNLHKSGHRYFPVVDKSMDHVVGILHLNKLVGDMRKSHTAKKAMDPEVNYIQETQSLNQALETFLHTGQHLLIVVNKSKKTVGVVGLQSLLEKLVGRKLENLETTNSQD